MKNDNASTGHLSWTSSLEKNLYFYDDVETSFVLCQLNYSCLFVIKKLWKISSDSNKFQYKYMLYISHLHMYFLFMVCININIKKCRCVKGLQFVNNKRVILLTVVSFIAGNCHNCQTYSHSCVGYLVCCLIPISLYSRYTPMVHKIVTNYFYSKMVDVQLLLCRQWIAKMY